MTDKEKNELFLAALEYQEQKIKQLQIGNPTVGPEQEALTVLDSIWSGNYQDPYANLYNNINGIPIGAGPYPQTPPNRGSGEDIPVQITWQQLFWIRNVSRVLCATNEYATSAIENRVNYAIGDGLTYEVVRRQGVGRNVDLGSFVSDCQALVDIFAEYNDLPSVEEEFQVRSDVDGEAFIRTFPKPDGSMPIRFVEPEWVRSPDGSNTPHMSYGIQTNRYDVQTVEGYWIMQDPFESQIPSFVDKEYVMHHKQRVMLSSKRGRPIFYPVFSNLKRTEALGRSISAMAVARAKIALIRRMKGATEDSAQAMVNKVKSITANDPVTGQARNIEQLPDGAIINTSDNMEYEYPAGNLGAADFLEVFKSELRGVAAALNLPEWMLTSNASDMGAYTSSLVSEAPANRSFRRQQRKVRQFFGDRCVMLNPSLCWRYLIHCARVGLIPGQYLRYVRIKTTASSLQATNPMEEANRHQIYFAMGVMTKNEIRAELGMDPIDDNDGSGKNFVPDVDKQSNGENNSQV